MKNFIVSGIMLFSIILSGMCVNAVEVTNDTENFNWQKVSPLKFIEILKERDRPFTVYNMPPENWVSEEDIAKLMKLIESEEPAAPTESCWSSLRPEGMSTVGREAMFIIEGYRKKRYPPELTSFSLRVKPEELKKWWYDRNSLKESK